MNDNRYAPPKAPVDAPHMEAASSTSPVLWNPDAAARWSILLTPVFGTWLHMRNWGAMGEPKRARTARIWLALAIACVLATAVLLAVWPQSTTLRFVNFGFLLVWYYGSGNKQSRLVETRFGIDYLRQPWSKPLQAAGGLIATYLIIVAVFAALGVV